MAQDTYTETDIEQYWEIRNALDTSCNALYYAMSHTNRKKEVIELMEKLHHELFDLSQTYKIDDMEITEEVQ